MTTAAPTTNHRDLAHGLFCPAHSATFEPQEAERNDGDCPWCSDPVEV